MNDDNTLTENIHDVEYLSSEIHSLLREISDKQVEYAGKLESIRDRLRKIYASMSVILEASDTFRSSVRKGEELLSFGLSLSGDILQRSSKFLDLIDEMKSNLEELSGKREEIKEITESLSDLNETSENTARNAEIQSYKAGESGKGFEVVAGEFGELTMVSREVVESMVSNFESIERKSQKTVDNFKTLTETITPFKDIISQLESSSSSLQDDFSSIIDTSDRLLELIENINRKRRNIEHTTETLLNLYRESLVKSGKINLIMEQKETTENIVFHLSEIYDEIEDKNQNIEFQTPRILLSLLNILSSLIHNGQRDLEELEVESLSGGIDISEIGEIDGLIEDIKLEVEKVENTVNSTKESSQKIIENIEKLNRFILDEKTEVKKISMIDEELSSISINLGRLVENVEGIAERARVLSLYGKIESSRISKDIQGIDVIVDRMETLSSEYSNIASKVNKFFAPLSGEIIKLSKLVERMKGLTSRMTDIVEEADKAYENNATQISSLVELSDYLKPTMNEQKEILSDVDKLIENLKEKGKETPELLEELNRQLSEEEGIINETLEKVKNVNVGNLKGSRELRIYMGGNPLHYDPAKCGDTTSSAVAAYLHRGLFNFGLSLGVYPNVISRWSFSDDALEWHFKLRDDVLTHTGEKIDAEDVKFSLERLTGGSNQFVIKPIDKIKVRGKYSIDISLKNPYMPLLSNLASIGGSLISRKYSKDQDIDPSGIGPFRFIEWEEDEHIILEANENYNLGKPLVDFLVYKRGESAYEAFKAGEVDIASIALKDVLKAKKDIEVKNNLIKSDFLGVDYMGFNFERKDSPFMDKKIRKAMNYALDNHALIKETASGLGKISRGVFPPGLSVYNPKIEGYKYDVKKARKMMKEAGYPEGLPEKHTLTISDSPTNIRRAEFLKKSFSKIGIELKMDKYPWGEFLERIHAGKHELFLLGWRGDTGDPDNFMSPLFYSENRGIGGNSTFFSNNLVDTMIEEGLREINPVKRQEIYRELEGILIEHAPWVFMTHTVNYILVRDNVYGFEPDPIGRPKYEWMGVK